MMSPTINHYLSHQKESEMSDVKMSDLKRFEMTLEVTSAEGSQVFACFADSELEARLKLGRGQCEIIEQIIEVIGLDAEPVEIVESDDISSRLASDKLSNAQELIAKLQADNELLREALESAQRGLAHSNYQFVKECVQLSDKALAATAKG